MNKQGTSGGMSQLDFMPLRKIGDKNIPIHLKPHSIISCLAKQKKVLI